MNAPITKVGAKAVAPVRESVPKPAGKAEVSKFERLREELNERLSAQLKLPPPVAQIPEQQKKVLESELRKRLETTRAKSPKELFRTEMKQIQGGIEKLSRAVAGMPEEGVFKVVRSRIADLDTQFKQSGKLLNGIARIDDPQSLLRVQMQLYGLSENITLMSKVVDQISSAMKTVLQTQV